MYFLKTLPFSLGACGVAAALFAGCGGGSGGGTPSPTSTPNATATPTAPPTGGPTTLLRDDFSGTALNRTNWDIYTEAQTLQRTRFGFTPAIVSENGISFARLRLDSYNPGAVGSFKGTEIFSRRRFARGSGLEMSARLRAPGLPPGLIVAFFGIFDRYSDPNNANDSTYLKDEIDFEILTAQTEQFSPSARNRLYLNIWKDWNLRNGFDGNDAGDSSRVNDDKTYGPSRSSDYDYANWNIYTIRWFPDRTEFYVNGVLERTETEVNPDEDLSVHFNMWTGNPDFNQAYSASLQPANSASNNRTYSFDVDYVTVTTLGASARTAAKFATPPASILKSYRSR